MRAITLLPWVLACAPEPEGTLEILEVEAESLDTTYQQSVYRHPEADTRPGAPWLLLLDGDVWAEDAALQLDRAVRRGLASPRVVVGLGNQRTRDRDYTPWPSDGVPEASAGSAGEVDAWFSWVLTEWLPAFEAETGLGGARESRSIAGHSYGGLATTWALYHTNDAFSCYGVVSPALWWDDGAALAYEADLDAARVAVVYGALEVASIAGLAHALAEQLARREDVRASEVRLEGDDHLTVAQRRAWGAVFEACP